MRVVRKVNNNVAECIDNNGQSLIAFGKGIGFPKTPYELKDLSKIDMTFYRLESSYLELINELPEDILTLSSELVTYAQGKLNGSLNPSLVFSLADHIQFAVKRLSEYKEMKLFFSNDIATLYPVETEISTEMVREINERLVVNLPDSEITSIAMHLINSQSEFKLSQEEEMIEFMIDEMTHMVEQSLDIVVEKNEFNYERFRMHMRYYLKRIRNNEQLIDNDSSVMQLIHKTKHSIYDVAVSLMDYIERHLQIKPAKEELLYLIIHINRLYEHNSSKEEEN